MNILAALLFIFASAVIAMNKMTNDSCCSVAYKPSLESLEVTPNTIVEPSGKRRKVDTVLTEFDQNAIQARNVTLQQEKNKLNQDWLDTITEYFHGATRVGYTKDEKCRLHATCEKISKGLTRIECELMSLEKRKLDYEHSKRKN